MSAERIFSRSWAPNGAHREYLDIVAEEGADGSLKFMRVDMGPRVEVDWGDYDLEQWFFIAAKDVPAALIAMTQHAFAGGDRMTWETLIKVLRTRGLAFEIEVWA